MVNEYDLLVSAAKVLMMVMAHDVLEPSPCLVPQ